MRCIYPGELCCCLGSLRVQVMSARADWLRVVIPPCPAALLLCILPCSHQQEDGLDSGSTPTSKCCLLVLLDLDFGFLGVRANGLLATFF